jgi:hypothetical protein
MCYEKYVKLALLALLIATPFSAVHATQTAPAAIKAKEAAPSCNKPQAKRLLMPSTRHGRSAMARARILRS